MKQATKLIALCLFLVFFFVSFSSADDVIVLDENNFEEIVLQSEFILVEFYAPWCGHCKRLEPEYAEAARRLTEEGSNIKLAKVDATENKKLAEQHNVRGFPTIKFYRSGNAIEYSGGRTADEIVSWLKKKSNDPVSILTEQNVTSFIDSNDVVIVAYFENPESESAKIYHEQAKLLDEHVFGVVSDKSLIGLEGSGVVLFKKFDEKKAVLNADFTHEELVNFVKDKSTPLLNYFAGSPSIFSREIRIHLFYFGNKEDENHAATETLLRSAAESFRDKVVFSFVDVLNPATQRVCEFFQVTKETAPAVYIFNLTEEGLDKFRPDSFPSDLESLKQFITSFFEGKLSPHYKTEEPVEYSGKGVRVLVGKDHDSIVSDSSKVVFVEYYAPWCGHCKNLAPIWEQLAEHFEGNDEVLIAKFDATANEVPSVSISGFPTLYLYNKENELVEFDGDRSLEGLIKFVQSILDGTYVPHQAEYGEGDEDYSDEEVEDGEAVDEGDYEDDGEDVEEDEDDEEEEEHESL